MGFLKGCYGSSIVFLLGSQWVPMRFLGYFYDVSMIFISMGFLLDSCGISIGFLWGCQSISMMFL